MSKKNTDYTGYSLPSEQNQNEPEEVNEVKEELLSKHRLPSLSRPSPRTRVRS